MFGLHGSMHSHFGAQRMIPKDKGLKEQRLWLKIKLWTLCRVCKCVLEKQILIFKSPIQGYNSRHSRKYFGAEYSFCSSGRFYREIYQAHRAKSSCISGCYLRNYYEVGRCKTNNVFLNHCVYGNHWKFLNHSYNCSLCLWKSVGWFYHQLVEQHAVVDASIKKLQVTI